MIRETLRTLGQVVRYAVRLRSGTLALLVLAGMIVVGLTAALTTVAPILIYPLL